jgi:hypothetical protein
MSVAAHAALHPLASRNTCSFLAILMTVVSCGGSPPTSPTGPAPSVLTSTTPENTGPAIPDDPPAAPPASDPGPGSNATWPNQPARLRTINDTAWDALTGRGWNYLRRTSSKDAHIARDPTAPLSPQQVLRIVFTPDMNRDSEPGVHWIRLSSRPREIFAGWWMKLSPNWRPSPAGGGKVTFVWPSDGQGVVYSNVGGSRAPHHINIATTWTAYGYRFWEPNISTTAVSYDTWYRIEWYLKWESRPGASDGIIRWWVNGTLNGDYRNVQYPRCCFQQFEFAPTLQNPPASEQYMYIDHTYVAAP